MPHVTSYLVPARPYGVEGSGADIKKGSLSAAV